MFAHLLYNQGCIYVMRFIILTTKERDELEIIHKTSTNFIERSRSFQLLLSGRKNSMTDVSKITNINIQAVARLFKAGSPPLQKIR